MNSRAKVEQAALTVARGGVLRGLSVKSLTQPGFCALFVRELVEAALGIPFNTWPIAVAAYEIARSEEHERFAVDYLDAAQRAGLARSGGTFYPGDILYQNNVSLPYGHTAVYAGYVDGVQSVVENTTVDRGVKVYGSGPVRLTPLSQWGTPTHVAAVSADALDESALDHPENDPNYPARGRTPTASGPLGSFAPGGVGATPSANTGADPSKNGKKGLWQTNENDWAFIERLGREIGYILSETEDGSELYFGPGIETGERPRIVLVRGEYTEGGASWAANVTRFRSGRRIYGIPSEIVVTGYDGGTRFSLIVKTEDLAARHKIHVDSKGALVRESDAELGQDTTDKLGSFGQGATGTLATAALANSDKTLVGQKDPKNKGQKALGGANFASDKVSVLLKDAFPIAKRVVLGNASSALEAKQRGLEALSLMALRFQEVEIDCVGLPYVRPGHEALLVGTGVPKSLQGLYLIRQVAGSASGDDGYSMTLTLSRNSD